MKEDNVSNHIKTFVKRKGRASKLQEKALAELSPMYCIQPQEDALLDWRQVFGNENPVVIEIGFGMGKATWEIALNRPDTNFLGIEVHRNGVGKLMAELNQRDICNVRIINDDALKVLKESVPNGSVEGFHIFFPDPWPKKRHHKRRLIQHSNIDTLVKKLKPEGYIYAVTDWEEYAHQMLQTLEDTPGLKNEFDSFAEPISWRPETRFEEKGLEKGHSINEVFFINYPEGCR